MAFLVLADGMTFHGRSVGFNECAVGEIVFNTSHTGYQEIMTDPSYHGQIITFTTAHVGNVGVNSQDNESQTTHASGVIFRDFSSKYSNWRGQSSLGDFLKNHQLVALSDIDTRALTLHLRSKGSQMGFLVADGSLSIQQAMELAQHHQMPSDSVSTVSVKQPYVFADPSQAKAHIVVVDCGAKKGILHALETYPVKITVAPFDLSFDQLSDLEADGVLLSNGPGNPESCSSVIELARTLMHRNIPLFGICLGHQIMALAAGAKTRKMKFGHHGANHPIQCCKTGAVLISSQNHGFVVDESSLPDFLSVTHVSLFDGTIAGLIHQHAPAFSFQGHPEASPGPNEFLMLFNLFIKQVYHAKKQCN